MTLAQYAMLLIIGWQVYNMARDSGLSVAEASGQLALVGLLQFIPLFVLTPIVGFVADRFDRRNIGRLTVLLQLVCACILGWFTWQSAINLPIILAVAVLLGIATPALPYAIGAVLMTISLIALSFISKVSQPAMPKDVRPIGQIRDGMRYVLRNKMVLGAITLDLIAVFLAGAGALLPAFARDILMVGEEGLALLAPAPGIGAALIALWFSFKPLKNNVGPKMLMAVAVFGFATIGFGLSRNLALSVFMLMLIGAADMFSVYIRQSLIQLHTPDDKRGRVSSVSMLTISASNEGGDAFSGGLAFLIGPVAAGIAGGASAVVTVAIWSRVFPVLRTTKTFDPPEEVLREDQSQTRQES